VARYIISAESTADDLLPVSFCIHEMLNRLPVTARSLKHPGVRIENGALVDSAYTGPILERAIQENAVQKTSPPSGAYRGVPVVVSPIQNDVGEAIGAIGVVDITGIFDLATLMEHQSAIIKQVCGKDPCPLPSEQISARK